MLLAVFIITLLFSINGQDSKSNLLKLIKDKPSVYISFHRLGKQKPLFKGESENRIWLRLNNNTKLKVFYCGFWVEKEYGDIGIYYDVKTYEPQPKSEELPLGYGGIDTCDVEIIDSGKSVLFSIPAEHLKKGFRIETKYYYGWTGNWKEDIFEGTVSSVRFSSSKISF